MYRGTRLQRLEERRNVRRAILMILGSIALILFLIWAGIPVLARLAGLISDLTMTSKPVDRTDLIPPGPPQIRSDFTATNSRIMTLSGNAEPGTTVYLTHNEEAAGNVVTKEDGAFEITDLVLSEGQNIFFAVAFDQAGNQSQMSSAVEIYHSTKTPKLELESPTDRQEVKGKTGRVDVKGITDPGVRVTANERFIIVSEDGRFSGSIDLKEGENTIAVVAVDRAGNQAKNEVAVIYQP